MCEVLALLGIVVVAWHILASYRFFSVSKSGRAPVVPGYPVIGNTLSLALHGAAYIHRCRMQVRPNLLLTPQAMHKIQK